MIVSDPWQGRGLGTLLVEQLIDIGRREKIQRITGHIMSDNWPMQALCKHLGFHIRHDAIEDEARAVYDLEPVPADGDMVS